MTITSSNISISNNRVAIALDNGLTIQFVIWDLEPNQHDDLTDQLIMACSICYTAADIERHLQLNGFDAVSEGVLLP